MLFGHALYFSVWPFIPFPYPLFLSFITYSFPLFVSFSLSLFPFIILYSLPLSPISFPYLFPSHFFSPFHYPLFPFLMIQLRSKFLPSTPPNTAISWTVTKPLTLTRLLFFLPSIHFILGLPPAKARCVIMKKKVNRSEVSWLKSPVVINALASWKRDLGTENNSEIYYGVDRICFLSAYSFFT